MQGDAAAQVKRKLILRNVLSRKDEKGEEDEEAVEALEGEEDEMKLIRELLGGRCFQAATL